MILSIYIHPILFIAEIIRLGVCIHKKFVYFELRVFLVSKCEDDIYYKIYNISDNSLNLYLIGLKVK